MDKLLTLTYASSLTDFCEFNTSFDKGVLAVAYPGVNRNRSNITKSAFENAIKSMYNVPVVCHYIREENKLGGHDMDVVTDSDGELELINLTEPVGVVPESAKQWWGEVTEDDGTIREYLYTEVLLWKRQQAYRKIIEDGVTMHSMEITVKSGELIDGIYNVYDFEFTAFCLIGIEPCFESSALETFSRESYQEKFKLMMQELKEINFSIISSQKEVDITTYPQNENSTEGGTMLDAKLELAKEYSIDVESLDFNIEDLTIEELKEKFEAMTAEQEPTGDAETETPEPSEEKQEDAGETETEEQEVEAEVKDDETDEPADEPEQYALTGATVEEIIRSLSSARVSTEWGECSQYCYFDCDFELSEIYCWDVTDGFLYGFKYAMDGDNVVIDFESKCRKKFAITDFDEGEQGTQMFQLFEQINAELAARAEYKTKFEAAQAELDTLNAEVTDLRAFKKGIQDEEKLAKYDEAMAEFSDLTGIEAFDALMENKLEYELDTLIEKCFAIRGRNVQNLKFSAAPKAPKIKVATDKTEDMPYGGIVEKYLNK